MASAPPCISPFLRSVSAGRVQNETPNPKTETTKNERTYGLHGWAALFLTFREPPLQTEYETTGAVAGLAEGSWIYNYI